MEELLGARVPQNPQAEQAVIGAMLIDPDCVPEVLKSARSEHFYTRANREIFETVLTMFNYGQTIDAVTLIERMKERGVYHEDTTPNYLAELIRVTPTSANVGEYLSILRDKSLQRDLGRVAGEISSMVNEGLGSADEMLELAERNIYALRRDRSIGGLRPVSDIVMTVYNEMSERAANGDQLPGITTGLVDLDNRLLGMNPGELIVIASRPGMGKTSIGMNIAMAAAKSTGKIVAVFNLEMSREQVVVRMLSSEALVNSQHIQRGNLNSEEWRRIVAAAGSISRTRIMIDDNTAMTVADMNAQCRRLGDELGLILVDYLQLMQSAGGRQSSNDNRQQVVSDISRMMKVMAKELRVPVICLCQLNRAAEGRSGGDRRPRLSDLRESGSIEQDADVVIGLYRESYYDKECANPTAAEAIILKNRKGQVGTVDLAWLPDYTSYVSVDTRHEE